jgi:hypothetical protein
MNEQNFGEQFRSVDVIESTGEYTNRPEVNSDPFADKVPVDAALIHETPMGGTVAAVGPMNPPVTDEVPMVQTPARSVEIPTDEIVPTVSPMDETVPTKAPMGEMITHEVPLIPSAGASVPLLNRQESEHFRTLWNEIQGKFVDDPRSAVQQADALVSEVVEQITQKFATEHSSLESQWKQGNDVSTEDLRKSLQHYRSFFNRLVA